MKQNSKILVERAYFFFKTFIRLQVSYLISIPIFFISSKKYIKCDGNLLTTNMSVQYSTTKFITWRPKRKRAPRQHPKKCVPFVQSNCAGHTSSFYQFQIFRYCFAQQARNSSRTAPFIPFRTSTSGCAQKLHIFVFIICFCLTLCPTYSSKFWISCYYFLTYCGPVTQICVFTLQLCKTDDPNLRF